MNAPAETRLVDLKVERYDYSDGFAEEASMRGTKVEADTGYDGRPFTEHFPRVWIADDGVTVSIDDYTLPADKTLAWFKAVADHLEARMDAS